MKPSPDSAARSRDRVWRGGRGSVSQRLPLLSGEPDPSQLLPRTGATAGTCFSMKSREIFPPGYTPELPGSFPRRPPRDCQALISSRDRRHRSPRNCVYPVPAPKPSPICFAFFFLFILIFLANIGQKSSFGEGSLSVFLKILTFTAFPPAHPTRNINSNNNKARGCF